MLMGIVIVKYVWPATVSKEEISGVSQVLVSTTATMAGFMLAVLALLFAVGDKPLTQHLGKRGVLRVMLIDIFGSTAMLVLGLIASLLASVPGFGYGNQLAATALAFCFGGVISLPLIGYGFWCLLTNLGLQAPPVPLGSAHRWNERTNLE